MTLPVAENLTLTYPIVETFHSIQGEGAWTGVSAFFIRLAGCDVYCPWCDQKESWNEKRYPHQSIDEIISQIVQLNPAIVVITGGEPLLHDLTPLSESLHRYALKLHLETSGSHPFSGEFDWVTFSPKRYKIPDPSIYPHVDELKIIIATESDLRWAEEEATKIPPHAIKYLQPEWNTPSSQALIFNYVRSHPQWRVSLQTHKFLGVR